MDEIEIREATPADAERIAQISYRVWLDTYPNEAAGITKDDIEHRFIPRLSPEGIAKRSNKLASAGPDERAIVALIQREIIGFCEAVRLEEHNQLRSIYVLPEYQGKGVGTKLWSAAKEFFDPAKDTIVELVEYNGKAIKFYEKLGFRDSGRRFSDPRFQMKSGATLPEMEMRMGALDKGEAQV